MKLYILIFFLSFNSYAEKMPVIYGSDNRTNMYEIKDQKILEISKSIAALIVKENVQDIILTTPYGIRHNLCHDEKFYDEPTAANCTAFLIAPDLIATAGHCAEEELCVRFSVVFGFEINKIGANPADIKSKDIYHCKKVIAAEKDPFVDFGILQLDRPVYDRPILKLKKETGIKPGENVWALGFPAGLPLKMTGPGSVRSLARGGEYFVTTLDSFGGNSGSPIFNSQTNEIEGILVRGEADFEWDNEKNCRAVKRCAENECRGEEVTNIRYVTKALKIP